MPPGVYVRKPAPTASEKFWQSFSRVGDCWIWNRLISSAGYGVLYRSKAEGGQRKVYAHRFSYELASGSIPAGLELDHLCRVTACVNPDHLEAVSHKENVGRGLRGPRRLCPMGHSYDDLGNLYVSPRGHRYCRECALVKQRLRRAQRKVA